MIILQAPYDLIQTTLFLPSPTFGDTLGALLGVNRKVTVNNTRYTYVKRKNRLRLNYTFELPKMKYFEVKYFVEVYSISYLRLTNDKNEVWKVRFVSEPFTFTTKTRDGRVETLLSFEGSLVNGSVINC